MSFDRDDPRDSYDYSDRPDPYERLRGNKVEAARVRVQAPAIVLILLGFFNLLGGVGLMATGGWFNSMQPEEFEKAVTEDDPEALNDWFEMGYTVQEVKNLFAYSTIGFGAGSLLTAAILLLGGVRMMALKWYGFSVLAALIAVLSPGGCCLFGLIGGIWVLIVLLNSDVRTAFR